jgi:hypothetical protein
MALRLRRGTDAQRQLITPQSGELIYTTDTNEVYVGDGVTPGGNKSFGSIPTSIDDLDDVDVSTDAPTNGQVLKWNSTQGKFLPAADTGSDFSASSIGDLGDVDLTTSPTVDQVLSWNGSNFAPIDPLNLVNGSSVNVDIVGDNSEIMVDTTSNTFRGTFDGDLSGSVFSDDSTLIIDGVNSLVIAEEIDSNSLTGNNTLSISNTGGTRLDSNESTALLGLRRESSSAITDDTTTYGRIFFEKLDTAGFLTSATITATKEKLEFVHSSTGDFLQDLNRLVWSDQKLGIGKDPTEVLDVNGNAVFTGDVLASAFKGTIALDDSSIIIDATNGSLIVGNIDVVGEVGNAPTNAGSVDSWLEVSVNGATKYIPLYV